MPITSKGTLIGKGLGFPFRLDTNGDRPKVVEGEQLLKDSIWQILQTDITERPFLVKQGTPYGTRLRRAIFEPESTVVDIANYEVKRALEIWEPRISVMGVSVKVDKMQNGRVGVFIGVTYRIRETNRVDNLVVPFYSAA